MTKLDLKKFAVGASAGALIIAAPFISGWEFRSNLAYLDPVAIPTICDGITKNVKMGDFLSDAKCDQLLLEEMLKSNQVINQNVTVPLPDTRRAALLSFIHNVGAGAFKSSTLLKELNAGRTYGACNELRKWVYAKGRVLSGLVNRREAERELCMRGLK